MDLKKCGLGLCLALVIQSPLRAQELKIIDVRRNIPLRDDEPAFKDFYINGGSGQGLKPNLVVTAVRKTTIRDPSGLQALGEINIPVGQLKIIYVQDGLAVGREFKLLGREELPMLEQIGIMGGDVLDLKGSFVDRRKPQAVAPATTTVAPNPALQLLPAAPAVAAPGAEGTIVPAAAPAAPVPVSTSQAPLPGLAADPTPAQAALPNTPQPGGPASGNPAPKMISVPIPSSNPENTGIPEAKASSLDYSPPAL